MPETLGIGIVKDHCQTLEPHVGYQTEVALAQDVVGSRTLMLAVTEVVDDHLLSKVMEKCATSVIGIARDHLHPPSQAGQLHEALIDL